MKRFVAVLVALTLCVLWSAGTASASTLVYQPESIALTIPAGTEEQVLIKVGVENSSASTCYLFFLDNFGNGNLPASWLSVSPARAFLFGSGGASSMLTIRVPSGTGSGLYSTYIQSRAMAAHDIPQPGNGIRIDVAVPAQCSGIPVVEVDSVLPEVVWPPDHSMTQVVVTGTVKMPNGCSVAEAGYSVEDEYGLLSGLGKIQIAASGSFSFALPVEAMRHGQDKDGRHYSITVYAKNEAGVGSSLTQSVIVPHDRSAR